MNDQDYRSGQNAVLDELAALLGCSVTTWSCCKKRIEELLEAERMLELHRNNAAWRFEVHPDLHNGPQCSHQTSMIRHPDMREWD